MRSLAVVCVLLMLPALALAQATVIGGTASNWAPSYGVYLAPYVPVVTTPSVTLGTVSPSAAGASNATYGNVAGASNATLDIVSPPPVGVFTQPVWYGQTGAEPSGEAGMQDGQRHGKRAFDFEYANQSVGTAQLMNSSGRKASRSYTNQDVDRQNQNNGMVKYDGKTEHI